MTFICMIGIIRTMSVSAVALLDFPSIIAVLKPPLCPVIGFLRLVEMAVMFSLVPIRQEEEGLYLTEVTRIPWIRTVPVTYSSMTPNLWF